MVIRFSTLILRHYACKAYLYVFHNADYQILKRLQPVYKERSFIKLFHVWDERSMAFNDKMLTAFVI